MKKSVVVLVNPQVVFLPGPKKSSGNPSSFTQQNDPTSARSAPNLGCESCRGKEKRSVGKPASREVGKTLQLSHLEQSDNLCFVKDEFLVCSKGGCWGDGHLQQNLDTRTVNVPRILRDCTWFLRQLEVHLIFKCCMSDLQPFWQEK